MTQIREIAEAWQPVSPKLIGARRLVLSLVYLIVIAGLVTLWLIPDAPRVLQIAYPIVAVIVYVWLWWLIGRRVRSFAYSERGDDLLVTSGILFERLVIVPYGRMQLVDVKTGPIDRLFGITTVQLHTAAATSDAGIPGLEPLVAAELRDRLAAKGESRSEGL